jgi:hypothetical protein
VGPQLNRRAFAFGLGAASLAPWPRSALAARPSTGSDICCRIIDTAFDLTSRAQAIRQAGVRTVIRYYAHHTGQWTGKVLSKTELAALEANDLSVAVVFQNYNNNPDNFLDPNKKVEDVMWARRHADDLKQPAGTPVYFGADFDLRHWKKGKSDSGITEQRIAAVKSYFEYARAELAKDGRKLGVYGCGATCEMLDGVADYFWLSASADFWRSGEYYNSRRWHLYQNRVDLTRAYGDHKPCPIDTNLANPDYENFGQWRRDGRRERDFQTASQKILDARSFVAVQRLCLTRDHPHRDNAALRADALSSVEQKALRYALSVKIIRQEGEHCGISLDEGDTIRAWCHHSDLSADRSMPLRARRHLAPNSTCTDQDVTGAATAQAEPRKRFSTAAAKSRPVKLPAQAPATPAAAAAEPAAPKLGALTASVHGIN